MWLVLFLSATLANLTLENLVISPVVRDIFRNVATQVSSSVNTVADVERLEFDYKPLTAYMCATGLALEGLSSFTYKVDEEFGHIDEKTGRVILEIPFTYKDLHVKLKRVVLSVQEYPFLDPAVSLHLNKKQKIALKQVYLKMSYQNDPDTTENRNSELKNCVIALEIRYPQISPDFVDPQGNVKEGDNFKFLLYSMIENKGKEISPAFFRILIESYKMAVESDGHCDFEGPNKEWNFPPKTTMSENFDVHCGGELDTEVDIVAKRKKVWWEKIKYNLGIKRN